MRLCASDRPMKFSLARFLAIAPFLFASLVHAAAPTSATIDADTHALLTEVQRAGVRYFYEFGHPVSGLTRVDTVRSPELCEIGGTGWGCFNLMVAAERGFVPREDIAKR